jgi:hypothetical protein
MSIAPARAARVARALWIVWAVLVWNVVFDHVIVAAGRQAIRATGRPSSGINGINIDEFMRPAIPRGLWIATVAASAILVIGFSCIQLTARAQSR